MLRVFIEDTYTGHCEEYFCDDFVFAGSNDRGEVFVSTTDDIDENMFLTNRLKQEI